MMVSHHKASGIGTLEREKIIVYSAPEFRQYRGQWKRGAIRGEVWLHEPGEEFPWTRMDGCAVEAIVRNRSGEPSAYHSDGPVVLGFPTVTVHVSYDGHHVYRYCPDEKRAKRLRRA